MRVTYHGFPLTTSFDVEHIGYAVVSLNLEKAPDLESLTAEHLRYSHPILSCILSKLFNLILYFVKTWVHPAGAASVYIQNIH